MICMRVKGGPGYEPGKNKAMNEDTSDGNYIIDTAHSSAPFSVRHLRISNVKGEFGKVSGTIVYDAGNLRAEKIEAAIDVGSINIENRVLSAGVRDGGWQVLLG
jgi:polyisoprenoid-binding protein YceI